MPLHSLDFLLFLTAVFRKAFIYTLIDGASVLEFAFYAADPAVHGRSRVRSILLSRNASPDWVAEDHSGTLSAQE